MKEERVNEMLLKIAKGIDEKCGCEHCPCSKDCHIYTQAECIGRIFNFLKTVVEE